MSTYLSKCCLCVHAGSSSPPYACSGESEYAGGGGSVEGGSGAGAGSGGGGGTLPAFSRFASFPRAPPHAAHALYSPPQLSPAHYHHQVTTRPRTLPRHYLYQAGPIVFMLLVAAGRPYNHCFTTQKSSNHYFRLKH